MVDEQGWRERQTKTIPTVVLTVSRSLAPASGRGLKLRSGHGECGQRDETPSTARYVRSARTSARRAGHRQSGENYFALQLNVVAWGRHGRARRVVHRMERS